MKGKYILCWSVMLLLVLLVSCKSKQVEKVVPVVASGFQLPLRDSHWQLERMGLDEVKEVAVTLDFAPEEMRISGRSFCNRYMASYTLEASRLQLSPIGSTRMACPELEQEQRYFDLLSKVRGYRLEAEHLRLLDSTGSELLRYKKFLEEAPETLSATIKPLAQQPKQGATLKASRGLVDLDQLVKLTRGKRVAVVMNTASKLIVGEQEQLLHSYLLEHGAQVKKILAPEHGWEMNHDAGASVKDTKAKDSKIPVLSLYGKTKKPTRQMLRDVDVIVYQLQDVGVRFFTYISTLEYVMEAASEQGKKVVVVDRPNPNDYVAGPVLQKDCKSFVGMQPIPIVYGLTAGEYALLLNGEGWLKGGKKAQLEVIRCLDWQHGQPYSLPDPPSPNLQTDRAIRLYPSLCLLEPSSLSVGRGTESPFEWYGYPKPAFGLYLFTPRAVEGKATEPKWLGQKCYGVDLRSAQEAPFTLNYLIDAYRRCKETNTPFFRSKTDRAMFHLLTGDKRLMTLLESGAPPKEMEQLWQKELEAYKVVRKKYLLY